MVDPDTRLRVAATKQQSNESITLLEDGNLGGGESYRATSLKHHSPDPRPLPTPRPRHLPSLARRRTSRLPDFCHLDPTRILAG